MPHLTQKVTVSGLHVAMPAKATAAVSDSDGSVEFAVELIVQRVDSFELPDAEAESVDIDWREWFLRIVECDDEGSELFVHEFVD